METDNFDRGPAEVESESKSIIPTEIDEKQESTAETKCDPVNVSGGVEHERKKNDSTGGETQIKPIPLATDNTVMPEITLVIIGDTNAVEIGSKNILLDLDQENVGQFSSKLYDLCGRHISVINMLGSQNIEEFPLNQDIHAFLLLLPNGPHASQYSSGVQWLEKAFGEGLLPYLMTVVTHRPDEKCESALTDLKANSSFVEKRYHTCTRSMVDEIEILSLLEKIDIMVSENDPHYSRLMCDGSQQNDDQKSHKEEKFDCSVSQQIPTEVEDMDVEEMGEPAADNKCVPETETAGTEALKNTDDRTGIEHNIKSVIPPEVEKTGILDMDMSENKDECDPENEPSGAEASENTEDRTGREHNIKSVIPSAVENTGTSDMDMSGNKDECDRENEPAGAEASEKTEDRTGREHNIKSDIPSATEKTGTQDMDTSGNKDEQSVTITEEIQQKKQYEKETETLLGRLQLQEKHRQKFSPADFLKIGTSVKQDHETSEKDIAYIFIQRLMMLDYRARYIPVRKDNSEGSQSKFIPVNDTVETEDNDLDGLFCSSADPDQSKPTHVHPMDVQMAVLHCSDSFFKQNMITKLSQCQYALPLLVPDPVTMDIDCPLWTFRQITKTWKITHMKDNSNMVTMKSMPICTAQTPMVSFLRLGSLSLSKSQLMNSLINDRHSTFFHRNCPGSTKSRHFMDGVVEIAWFCPSGKRNDAFTDCVAFCNLHGDAHLIEKQREIMTEKSSINVVLVPTLGKGDKSTTVISALYKSPKPLIILIADNDCGAVQIKEGKYKLGLKDRSHSDVSEELKGIIGKLLSRQHDSFQLETMAEVPGIRVDEDDTVCRKGKSAAMKTGFLLQRMDVSKIKDTFLPCQGQLWHEWCKINKELHHLTGNIENERCEKQQEQMQIRQHQCAASTKLMKIFIESLSSLPSTDREYFLKWTQILIDALSTDDLSSILQSYDEKWSEVLALKKKHDKSNELKRKQIELDLISTKLQSATFGLEHIFREMGQIYEAHTSLQKQAKKGPTDWSKYPEMAAELMIAGHPMELMDGDAGHVPLTWISSLLDEVINKLGDQKVFVLSVLGVQSSGKSTMLNAMFGLQFAVSAGRCTKGAFMQLVKVSEEMRKDFEFDYVLVVDTEGLRALELAGNATLHHDNELATFVVGLGNMTLINIFGENPAEMQDVLQIVVQAFMRMKKVKLSPSCVFVHQNVSDIAAAEKNMDGKRRLQEKLDQMAQLAAKEEDCDAECFSDVIAFDVQKDVKYFAQLWEGSPPMAPPNPGYSESIQELKNTILTKAQTSKGITLSQFKSKIKDLWNALMNENFVFSFKNTLEIAVYRRLEVHYGDWIWALRSNMLTIENQLYTRIENGKLDKVEPTHLYDEMSKTFGEIKKKMTTYFDDKRDKEMLVQWRGRFENKIKDFHDEQVTGVKRKLDEVIQQKKACKKLDDKKTDYENKLLQKSKDLAHQLKDKAKDEKELKKRFDSLWNHWVTELTRDTKPIEDIKLDYDQYLSILLELGFEWSLINDCKSSNRYKNISEVENHLDYITLKKNQDLFNGRQNCQNREKGTKDTSKQGKWSYNPWEIVKYLFANASKEGKQQNKSDLPYEEQQLMTSLIDNVEKQSLVAIKGKPVATRGYSPTYLQEVAKSVQKIVAEFESGRKYALRKEFTVDLILFIFDRAESWLLETHKKFKMNNDALTYLQSKKEQYYNIFRSFCEGNSSAVVFGELICEKLKSSAVEAVCNKTAIDLAGEMRCSSPAFNGNRLNLEKHVLKSLAEKEDFDGFITYIRHPRNQAESFVKEEVEKYIFSEQRDKAQTMLKKKVEDLKTRLRQALFTATEEVKTRKGNIDMWVEAFSSLVKDELTFTVCCQNFSDIKLFDFLKEEIERGLESIIQEMNGLSLDKMKEFRLQPDQILIDQLCNCCWVTCPFCAAVCTNTLKDHSPDDHSVPFHRSEAVNGVHYRNTVELVIDFCTSKVASDRSFYPNETELLIPYKEYRTAGPRYADWRITPDESKLPYWKWFVCRFEKQLEDHHKLKFQGLGEIPSEWRNHTKQEAIESLDEMFKSE